MLIYAIAFCCGSLFSCVSHVAAVLRMRAPQQHRWRREQSVRQLQRNSFVSAARCCRRLLLQLSLYLEFN